MRKRLTLLILFGFVLTIQSQEKLSCPKEWKKSFSNLLSFKCNYLNELYSELNSYMAAGMYSEAANLTHRIYANIQDAKTNPIYASELNRFSEISYKANLLGLAINYGKESEEAWQLVGPYFRQKYEATIKKHYIRSIINLAVLYYATRDIGNAELWITKGIELTEKNADLYPFYYELLHIQACLYDLFGRKQEALEIEEFIINNANVISLQWKIDYIQFLYNCNQTDRAISAMSDLLAEQKDKGFNETIEYANLLHRLAVYYEKRDAQRSISLTLEAIEILKHNKAMTQRVYAECLGNLASFYSQIGNKEEAIKSEEEALIIWSIIGNTNSPEKNFSQRKLSVYQFENQQWRDAEENMVKSTHTLDENIMYSMMQTEEVRRNIWDGNKVWYMNTIPYYASYIGSDSLYSTAYNAALLSKGMLLNTEKNISEIVNEGNDVLRNKYDQWQTAKSRLSLINSNETIENLKKNAYEKEKVLMQELISQTNAFKRLSVRWTDVKKILNREDLAIEFCSYNQGNRINYIALLIKKDMNSPKLIPLFSESQLNSIKKGIYTIQNGSKMIWQPIEKYLQNVKNIYFSPCGELNNIAIESLPHWSDKCLMSDKWNLYRLSSTRELVIAENNSSIEKAVVYGGINYNASIDMLLNQSKSAPNSQTLHSHRYDSLFQNELKKINICSLANRSVTDQYNYMNPTQYTEFLGQRGGYGYLEGTKKEAEEVCRLLGHTNIQTTLYTESNATEGTVKELSGKKVNLLHIGTHGFYFPEREVQYRTHLTFLHQFNNESPYIEDKTLTRSGLLFSGANNTWEGKKVPIGIDDGILTAQEISHLDLRGLDLVVLAACKTGLGEIKGDGVFGLQRGFKKAGANSLLMTLWDVNDEVTSLLMSQFYKNLLSGKSKSESLRQAQIITQEKYQDPKFWAGFILLDAIN